MMEPVAYAAFADNGNIRIWSQEPGRVDAAAAVDDFKVEPLVRLSDAEARIAEITKWRDEWKDMATELKSLVEEWQARAEAAEALLKEAGTEKAARVMSDPCVQKLEDDEPFFVLLGRDADASHALATWITLRLRSEGRTAKVKAAEETLDAFRDCQDRRAARAIHHKIGVKDE